MMKFLTMAALLGVSVVSEARLRQPAAPRATDLLRAKKLADQMERRLQLPPASGGGWEHGGSGWDAGVKRTPEEPSSVRIEIHQPRHRRARP